MVKVHPSYPVSHSPGEFDLTHLSREISILSDEVGLASALSEPEVLPELGPELSGRVLSKSKVLGSTPSSSEDKTYLVMPKPMLSFLTTGVCPAGGLWAGAVT